MKRVYFLGLLIVLALVLTPLSVLAQDDEFEDFESEDGLLTLSYPAGWLTEEDTEFLPTFMAGTTENAIEQMQADVTKPESGDLLLFVMILPTDFLNMMGAELEPDMSLTDLTTMIGTMFLSPEDPEAGNMPEFEDAEEIELDDDVTIGQMAFADDYAQGVFMMRKLSDDLLVVSLAGTAVGEFSEDIAALGEHAVASVAYAGTSEDISRRDDGLT
jgi:hypothetical protein